MLAYEANGIPYFRFRNLSQQPNLVHAVFTRQGGIGCPPYSSLNVSLRVGDSPKIVEANRHLLCQALGIATDSLVTAHLVHGSAVELVEERYESPPRVDALITHRPENYLMITYADCVPILVYDPVNEAVGLGHAGWRSTVGRIVGAMVKAMEASFGSHPDNLLAAIGPSIGPCCYAIREDVESLVRTELSGGDGLLVPGSMGQLHLDLWRANLEQLLEVGLRRERIEVAELCTACHTDAFFSHRAERGLTGRFGVVIGVMHEQEPIQPNRGGPG